MTQGPDNQLSPQTPPDQSNPEAVPHARTALEHATPDSDQCRWDAAGRGWLGWSLAGGAVIGVPAGWLLAYLVAIPALGLFFFMLIGLLIGAVMYRLGRAATPVPRGRLWALGLAVSLLVWVTVLAAEYRWLPHDAAKVVVRNSLLPDANAARVAEFEAEVRSKVHEQLRAAYPPGGFLGYLRMSATSRTLKLDRPGGQDPYVFRMPGKAVIWHLRVIFTLVLLAFSILSQVLGLARVPVQQSSHSQDVTTGRES